MKLPTIACKLCEIERSKRSAQPQHKRNYEVSCLELYLNRQNLTWFVALWDLSKLTYACMRCVASSPHGRLPILFWIFVPWNSIRFLRLCHRKVRECTYFRLSHGYVRTLIVTELLISNPKHKNLKKSSACSVKKV